MVLKSHLQIGLLFYHERPDDRVRKIGLELLPLQECITGKRVFVMGFILNKGAWPWFFQRFLDC